MKGKRLSALLLTLLLILSLPFSVAALRVKEDMEIAPIGKDLASVAPVGYDINILEKYIDDLDAFKEYIIAETKDMNEIIYIGDYEIPMDKEAYTAIAYYICKDVPDVFHVGSVGYSILGGTLQTMNVEYLYTREEYSEMMSQCEAVADEMLADIIAAEHLSQADKALLIHDRLALLCNYDHELACENKFDIYGALIKKFAVCEGYTKAYIYLLDKVGIKSEICTSDSLRHAWNIVYIDDIPYHVDVTWDDIIGLAGEVYHDNFLLSTQALYEGGSDMFVNGHAADDYNKTPSDTRYDDYFWRNSYSAFQLLDGELYYVDSKKCTINRYSAEGTEELYKCRSRWNKYWNLYCRLSTDGETLFYSTNTSICELDKDTLTSTEIFVPEEVKSGLEIYGFEYKDEYLICDLAATNNYYNSEVIRIDKLYEKTTQEVTKVPVYIEVIIPFEVACCPVGSEIKPEDISMEIVYTDGSSQNIKEGFLIGVFDSSTVGKKTVYITWQGIVTSFEVNVYLPGDVNDDGKISIVDATAIQKHLASIITLSDRQKAAAEVTNDLKVSISDATKIQKFLAGIISEM